MTGTDTRNTLWRRALTGLVLCCALACAASADPMPQSSPPSPALQQLAHDSNAFAFELYGKLRGQPGNLVVSPASIMTALAMAWGGAREQTAAQMQRALHLEGTPEAVMQASGELSRLLQDPNQPIKFRIANRLFGERSYSFLQPYLDATRAAYGAPLEAVDFRDHHEEVRRRINGWVERQTEQRIRDLIPAGGVGRDTRLALVNAIYFLGDWERPFAKEATAPAPFFLAAAQKKDVPTMHAQLPLRFAQQDGCKALELPYKGRGLSMLLVLPDQLDGLDALERALDGAAFDRLVQALQPHTVKVAVPKFELSPGTLALGGLLQQLGMSLAFDPHQADFTGIANPPDPQDRLYLSQVFHKAYVRVDEKGTEAAAATAVIATRAMAVMRPVEVLEFIADHPFLFFIRDNASGMILFEGRVIAP